MRCHLSASNAVSAQGANLEPSTGLLGRCYCLGKGFCSWLIQNCTTTMSGTFPQAKAKKCNLFRAETEFLGKVVSSTGISIAT